MKTTREFLHQLLSLGVQLWDDDGYLGYRGPDEVLTPALMAQLKERKAEILRFLQGTQDDPKLSPILSVPRHGHLALSFAQQRLWFLDQLGSGIAYNLPGALNLRGPLNVAALRSSLQEIVQRHESLRTTFAVDEGTPYQVIHSQMTSLLPVINLSAVAAQEQALEIKRLTDAEATRPFDLSRDAMLRATLLRLNAPNRMDTQHILLLTLHHIASDGWSLGVLVRELAALYEAFSQARPSPLPDLPIQYADFAVWQRNYLEGEVLEQQSSYWKERLAGAPPLLQLPTDRPRPAEQSFYADVVPIEIDADLTNGLRRLSVDSGATLYMTLLAAFQVLMFRYTGQSDVVIGSPIANRNRQEIEPLIGFFVNTLAMRADLAGSDGEPKSFLSLLAQTKETTQAAYDHQDLPFERLVEELQPDRNTNYNPLVQLLFALQNAPRDPFHLPGLTVTQASSGVYTTRFDYELHLWEVDNQLQGSCIYSTDLFDKQTIQRMMGHFQTLLAGIVADPQRSIAELPLLTEAERHQILVEWNDTATDYANAARKSIHQLFEQQVTRTPQATALIFGDQQLTYHDLNRRANQLAHYLISLGVAEETRLGICVERGILMVVGVLAILKAGAAYVPLDPSLPQERLAFMLQDADVSVLLIQNALQESLPSTTAHVVCLDDEWSTITQQNHQNLERQLSSSNLAYLLYTSGSTGRPKGVAMQHDALVNLLQWQAEQTKVLAPRTVQFAPISFDVSFQEIFSTWCVGGTLYLLNEQTRRDPTALLTFLCKHQIQRLFLPFIALQQLTSVAQSQSDTWPHLAEVITAGEQLQITPAIAKFFARLPHCTFWNHYGPTEAHVVSTFELPVDREAWPKFPPIGKAVANSKLYILDSQRQPTPIGVRGEVYIGGVQVARGYHKRPLLTAEKFIANPFAPQDNPGRLYKTGDLARWLPASRGNIEFLGRIDHQVKIRGFRIELGEIEAVLSQHPDVQETVVVARFDSNQQQRLVAYVAAKGGKGQEPATWRDYLKQKLPDYMLPSAFVRLDALPLTPNGKVNRQALPEPDRSAMSSKQMFVPPRTLAEIITADIWSEVLGIEQIGIHDNFFELGGHSLLATQVMSRMEAKLNMRIPLKNLFERPTVKGLAERMDVLQLIPGLSTGADSPMTDDEEEGEL